MPATSTRCAARSSRCGPNWMRSPRFPTVPEASGGESAASARSMWVFGYGSLVDPASLGATLGRAVTPGVDFVEADLAGWGRRWNYGVGHVTGAWRRADGRLVEDGVLVALGRVPSAAEEVNG